jgi:hypothetical protein
MDSGGNDRDGNGGRPGDPAPMTSELTTPSPDDGLDGGSRRGDDHDAVSAAAAAFVTAVAWGEHLLVWDLFSAEARRLVLRVAVTRGMDEQLAARLRDGTASTTERDIFLADLVNGLRADLRGADLECLQFDPPPGYDRSDPNRTRVVLMTPVVNPLLGAPLPVATIELVHERGQWRVEHLLPQAQK